MELKDLLLHYVQEYEKKWIYWLWHRAERVQETLSLYKTDFLDPYLQRISTDVLAQFPQVSYLIYGGYQQAERVCFFLWPGTWGETPEPNGLGFVQVEGDFARYNLQHRDFLGSILGLGIDRNKVGDVIYDGSALCQVVLDENVLSLVLGNWKRVGLIDIQPREISAQQIVVPEERYKAIKGTVASPRLDAVASLGFGLSRSKTAVLAKGEQIKVNWQVVRSPAYKIQPGDVISLMGKGRVVVESFAGISRKGRLHLLLKKVL